MDSSSMQASVESAYKAIHTSIFVNSLIGFAQILGLGFIVSKILKSFGKTFQNKEVNMRALLDEYKHVIYAIMFMGVFPVILYYFELILSMGQDAIIKNLGAPANQTILDNVHAQVAKTFVVLQKQWAEGGVFSVNAICRGILLPVMMGFYSLCDWILKYVYFMFMAGRYLWLLMLEVVAPFAIMFYLEEKTRTYFMAWAKNMMLCYLMIPMFLLADIFSEQLFRVIFDTNTIEVWGFLSILVMLIIKLAMYKVVINKLYHLF